MRNCAWLRYTATLLPAVLLIVSCAVEKRRYMKRFYAAGLKKNHPAATVSPTGKTARLQQKKPAIASPVTADAAPVIRDANNHRPRITVSAAEKTIFFFNDTCDIITLRNGREIRASVREITAELVKYIDCGIPDGPLFISRKSEILVIRYPNGKTETFIQSEKRETFTEPVAPVAHPKAALVYVLAILGWIPGIGSIPALVIGYRVLRDMRAEPEKYAGKAGIITAIVFSWLKILYLAFVFLIIFSALNGLFW